MKSLIQLYSKFLLNLQTKMTTKPEKVKEPSSGEAIASAADHEDLDDEKLTGFTILPGK